jgi:UDP-N-acetylmuramate--alanine ligase
MATEILAVAGMDPTGFVGGRVAGWGGNLRFGSDDLYVVEADEYDRSFHTLRPHLAVVTNLEADHLDIYGDLEGVREGFRTFLRGLRSGGAAVVCGDDSGGSSLVAGLGRAGYTYGLSAGCQLRAVDVDVDHAATRCRVIEDGADAGELALSLGGVHNLRNALGAAAAARHLGVDWPRIREALASFRGVARRFERLGEVDGVTLVDDYAHHPTEIRATLAAARSSFGGRRLVVAFQPHLYSRTRDFSAEFGAALSGADVVWITDVFPAREAAIPGVTGELITDAARSSGAKDVRYHADLSGLDEAIAESLKDGDVVLTLGAGSIESLGPRILKRLQEGIHA